MMTSELKFYMILHKSVKVRLSCDVFHVTRCSPDSEIKRSTGVIISHSYSFNRRSSGCSRSSL